MANVETMGLGPQKSLFVLVIIVGCFAVLWPRILSPMVMGPVKDGLSPNHFDREAGCCDVLSDSDVNAVRIMAEVCHNILKSQDKMDSKMEQALSSGILSKDIISTCRQEVNKTCGVDIAMFLDHNIRLGKTFKQILDDVRSYNSSNCLKMNYGVAPWALGVPHLVGKFWLENFSTKSVRQERPPHLPHPPLHPALRERGRAIVPPASVPRVRAPAPLPGRVWPSPLHVYLSNYSTEPMPVRPPMGGAGGVVPPPKSSVGFLMPLYTLCIVVFFFYTIFKMVFSKNTHSISPVHQQSYIDRPETKFQQSVFKRTSKKDRQSPETKLVVNAISGLVAEVRQQMEETERNGNDAIHPQDAPPHPYTNGSLHRNQREASPIITKDFAHFKETTPPSWEDSTPVDREETVLAKEFTAREPSPDRDFSAPPKDDSPPLITKENEDFETEKAVLKDRSVVASHPTADLLTDSEHVPEKIGEVVDEKPILDVAVERPVAEEEAIRQLRSSVEKENASFKPPVEVSSIFLEGALPHQSRLLVADSETHTETLTNGDDRDTPIVLSGKMTLSLINDESTKTTPERDNAVKDDLPYDDDDEFVTASAATVPKQDAEEYEYGSEEEIEEDEIDEDMEVVRKIVDEPTAVQAEYIQSESRKGEKDVEDELIAAVENLQETKEEVIASSNDQSDLVEAQDAAKIADFEDFDVEEEITASEEVNIQEAVTASEEDNIQEAVTASEEDIIHEAVTASEEDIIQEAVTASEADSFQEAVTASVEDIIQEAIRASEEAYIQEAVTASEEDNMAEEATASEGVNIDEDVTASDGLMVDEEVIADEEDSIAVCLEDIVYAGTLEDNVDYVADDFETHFDELNKNDFEARAVEDITPYTTRNDVESGLEDDFTSSILEQEKSKVEGSTLDDISARSEFLDPHTDYVISVADQEVTGTNIESESAELDNLAIGDVSLDGSQLDSLNVESNKASNVNREALNVLEEDTDNTEDKTSYSEPRQDISVEGDVSNNLERDGPQFKKPEVVDIDSQNAYEDDDEYEEDEEEIIEEEVEEEEEIEEVEEEEVEEVEEEEEVIEVEVEEEVPQGPELRKA